MSRKTFKAGGWLFKEGDVPRSIIYKLTGIPRHIIYKLIKGKVSIYKGDKRINIIEVAEGMKPRLLGVISALTSDRSRSVSVVTDTDVEVEIMYSDHIKGLLKNDMPPEVRDDIEAIIKSIVVRDKIKQLQRELFDISPSEKLDIPNNVNPEVSELLSELMEVYENSRYFY